MALTSLALRQGFDYKPRATITDVRTGTFYNQNQTGGVLVVRVVNESLGALLTLRSDAGGITPIDPENGYYQLNFSRTSLATITDPDAAKTLFVWAEEAGEYYDLGNIPFSLAKDPTG